MGVRASRGVDNDTLSYQKGSRERRTLCVIVHTEFCVNVVLGRSRPGERGKNDAMGDGQSADLERSEESRRIGGRRHLSVELSGSRGNRGFQET